MQWVALLHTFRDDMKGGDYGHSLHHVGKSDLIAHLSTLSRKGYHVSRLATWTSVKPGADGALLLSPPSANTPLRPYSWDPALSTNFMDASSSYHLRVTRVESSEWWCPFPTIHCYRSATTMSTARGFRCTRHLTRRGSSFHTSHSYRPGYHCFRTFARPYRRLRPSAWQSACNIVLNTLPITAAAVNDTKGSPPLIGRQGVNGRDDQDVSDSLYSESRGRRERASRGGRECPLLTAWHPLLQQHPHCRPWTIVQPLFSLHQQLSTERSPNGAKALAHSQLHTYHADWKMTSDLLQFAKLLHISVLGFVWLFIYSGLAETRLTLRVLSLYLLTLRLLNSNRQLHIHTYI